jgi:nucleoside-diphosphate-sugar epimerase
MKLLITGGTGFVGVRLARVLLARGHLAGREIAEVVLTDQFAAGPAADVVADARARVRVAPLQSVAEALRNAPEGFDGVFHLASAVSGECEADFDLGMRSNLDGTRALLEALRVQQAAAPGGTPPPRFVFSSSIAVFGPDPSVPLPVPVADTTLPAPQTSYGTQKAICEWLLADFTRKGFVEGRSVRLMTVTVRPGRPNGAASSFFSGIVREPLAGEEAICPVDAAVAHPVSSPRRTVEGLIAAFEADRAALGGRLALNLPALNVTVGGMLAALEAVAGRAVRERVRFERDERIAGIVANWPRAASFDRATTLGLAPEARFEDIVQAYIDDHAGHPTALAGLARRV